MGQVTIVVCDKCGAKAPWAAGKNPFSDVRFTIEERADYRATLCRACIDPIEKLMIIEDIHKMTANAAGEIATMLALAEERKPLRGRRRG
jgi:hypothetical protein